MKTEHKAYNVRVWRLFGVSHRTRDIFTHSTIISEKLQLLTYARYLWPLSCEGPEACHTYCGTLHPLVMVIFYDPWLSHLLLSVYHWIRHYLFKRFYSVTSGVRTPNLLPLLVLFKLYTLLAYLHDLFYCHYRNMSW